AFKPVAKNLANMQNGFCVRIWLEADCGRLTNQPGIGAPRPELGDGVRMLPHGRYLIFYWANEDVVRIARVLHSARDMGTAFQQ
ncbi:type II toxin-antitoxin system RelE/ParE family toxin, partial [Candidatus Accumulibacter aalborgensis]|uniref:type II toxin-antitoxin system RelE/ParE family toxin n=1 Tax=Candidatus Accumulibacter aalborgensis TaxID=1860102 RepID=UPI0016445A93